MGGVVWEILYSEPFEEWWDGLTEGQQDALTARIELLKERGPNLGRPTVEHIESSRHHLYDEYLASEGLS